ncbi:protein decapping 5-like [Gossypium australe]|uniref:Protein decapping 5-like n=1 Tax=Gossypium australe TaxID=47621 RepID=A0A5B6UT91_9ROSI|nr:protein decapping 5-like [Gossypium australe]
MAAENSSSKSASTADSYIGSLISLTSKSEIRYEGVLYNINPDESSIGLRNVRSFGTEGRKKDGPQVPPSDKVYEYILFRGSDIKDLQVKSSPPTQPTPPINNDPAIIQSHFPHSVSTTTSMPSAASGPLTDLTSHNTQMGLAGFNFQAALPLYQPGGNIGSWGASPQPPTANGSGLAMPMYWQGYYAPPNALPHLHQQTLLRPSPGLSVPPSMPQPMQYPNFNASLPAGSANLHSSSLPEIPPSLLPAGTSSHMLTSSSLSSATSSSLPPAPSATLASETLSASLPNKAPSPAPTPATLSASSPALAPLTSCSPELNSIAPPIANKRSEIPTLPYQSASQVASSVIGVSNSIRVETSTPSLVTPGQLLQSGSTVVPSSQPAATAHKDVEVVQVSSSLSPEPSVPVVSEAQPPLLPLPVSSHVAPKKFAPEATSLGCYTYRTESAPGVLIFVSQDFEFEISTFFQMELPFNLAMVIEDMKEEEEEELGLNHFISSRPVTKFTEDFDFVAMNEKFKKDEVWGHLGNSSKSHTKDKEADAVDEYGSQDEDDAEISKIQTKPVYNKDDFFDTLSCNALDNDSPNGRPRFSEQMKLDTETFGYFSRHRGGRGRGPGRGRGGRFRGGYYGRGYGYVGRGRG